MKAVTILAVLAMICLAIPAGADVRALYTMTQNPGDIFMVDSSGYGNDLLVGNLGPNGAPDGTTCWNTPGIFDPLTTAWTIAGRDWDLDDPLNTSLHSGLDGDLVIEADINVHYGGGQAAIVAHNYSADYGLFTNDAGNDQYTLEYSSFAGFASANTPYGWYRMHDTTLLNEHQWYHITLVVDRFVSGTGPADSLDLVTFYVDGNPGASVLVSNNGGGGSAAGRLDVAGFPSNWGKYLDMELDNLSIDITPIPEPSIMLVGLLALLKLRRK